MKMLKNKFMLIMLLLLITSITAFGCSSEDDTASSETGDEEATSESEAGGELKVAFYQQPPSMDPHMSTSAATGMITRHVFEGLMALNENYESVPMLAESIEESDDGLTYTFHLREGIKFHNDKEMVAEDIVASMERWMEKNTSADLIYSGSEWVEEDDYTVSLVLETPATGVLDAMAPILQAPAIMPKEVIDEADETGVTEYIGTGPFKFEEWIQDQHIHVSKFADYEPVDMEPSGLAGKKEALIDDIYFEIVTDASTRMAGMSAGEYDVAYAMPNDSYEDLKADEHIITYEAPAGHLYLIFNKKEGIFTDPKMRQAVNSALNIDEILLAAYTHEDLYELDHGYMSKHAANWYSETGKSFYNQNDQEAAEKLMEEAGYDGEEFTVLTSQDVPTIYNAAVVIQEQMKQVGINVNLGDYDWATVSEKREDPSEWGFYVNNVPDVNVPAQILPLGTTWPGWADDDKLVGLHKDIVEASSSEEAKEIWGDLQEYAWGEYVPAIKIGNYYSLEVTSDNLEGTTVFHSLVLWNTKKVNE